MNRPPRRATPPLIRADAPGAYLDFGFTTSGGDRVLDGWASPWGLTTPVFTEEGAVPAEATITLSVTGLMRWTLATPPAFSTSSARVSWKSPDLTLKASSI